MQSRKAFLLFLVFILSSVIYSQAKKANPVYGMHIFQNIEQIEYCVPVPLKDYTETKNDQRAKHIFENKLNRKYKLIVQGMFRENTQIGLTEYFNYSYTSKDDEDGKIIIKKELFEKNNCFYAFGYWSNMFYQSRFLEVTWLRNDDVIKLTVTYPLKDTALWDKRMNIMVRHNSQCL